ncbi:hypothetical protein OsJ_18871 [Oryza sativa Japonica Group]|uniref:Uncharacterized protein n=1 Tax=Oryza sativa subsp. japonica TaxID=39947 RepID=B9FJK8_ORYSJ|nr:hypothetical protein OsJ_18871 [Oryza sativa Japonica Group]
MAQESLRLVSHPIAAHEGRLPRHYTLEGQGAKKDISPPVEWYGGLPEGFSGKEGAAAREYGGIQEGVNDWKQPGWRGPIPPSRGHRIQFKLYALDDEVTKDKLMDAIEGHVLGEAELMAVF